MSTQQNDLLQRTIYDGCELNIVDEVEEFLNNLKNNYEDWI